MAGVLDQGWNEQYVNEPFPDMPTQPFVTRVVAARPPRQYEFPTGFNTYFGAERFQVGEEFFYHSPQLVVRRHPAFTTHCFS